MEATVKKSVMAMCTAVVVSAAVHAEGPPPVEMELGAAVMSQYVWRGIRVHDETAFQPSLTLKSGDFSANAWADFAADDMVDDVTEIDYTLSYAFNAGEDVAMELGYIHYTFDNDFDDTGEVYLAASLPNVMLEPSATLYYDVVEAEGAYLSLGAGYAMPLGEEAELSLSGSVGIMDAEQADFYMGVDEAGISDAAVTVEIGMDLTESLSMSVSGTYSIIVDDDYRDNMTDEDNFVFGVGFSYAF